MMLRRCRRTYLREHIPTAQPPLREEAERFHLPAKAIPHQRASSEEEEEEDQLETHRDGLHHSASTKVTSQGITSRTGRVLALAGIHQVNCDEANK